ncbi:UPF0389 protein CG9231 [Cylas formicarius]|uniref:UPF0389 protein CG9231 n=1 Tax=Cylas formicarius TaxID=197179 RepID=UPI002958CFE6|nr:UPF0389 protein CG9231 [Cylas formicarius]
MNSLLRAISSETKYTKLRNFSKDNLQAAYKPTNWEKRYLVWTGRFKNIEEIPELLPHATIDKARNRMRIKAANYMILGTILGCCLMVFLGKEDAKRGDTLVKRNLDWHKQLKEEEKNKTTN